MILLLALLFLTCDVSFSYIPEETINKGKTVKTKSSESKNAGMDENIRQPETKNTASVNFPPPPDKGGKKTRGPVWYTIIDNWTPWYIKIYEDGIYKATLGPWERRSTHIDENCSLMYGRAEFDDGSLRLWGPVRICRDTWELDQ